MKTFRGKFIVSLITILIAGCSDEGAQGDTAQTASNSGTPIQEKVLVGDRNNGLSLAKHCTECHGLNGNAAKKGAPFIAGLDQQYLIRSMLAYTNGSRTHEQMEKLGELMKPDEVADVSAYYASLDTPWTGGALITPTPLAHNRKAISRGKAAAMACDSCHGQDHHFSKTEVPSLAGMHPRYFTTSLKAYYNGQRHDRIMDLLEYMLKDVSINDLAAYYAAQTPKRPPHPTGGDPRRGAKTALTCAGCHGSDGNSPNPGVPSLSGHHQDYLYKATLDYRDGKRKHAVMRAAVRDLSVDEVRDLSAYYAGQTPDNGLFYTVGNEKHFDPVKDGARIASACNGCHGKGGNSVTPGTPSLTGLHVKYLARATTEYRDGMRPHAAMKTMVDYLDDTAIEKVSFYYALQEPASRKQKIQGDTERGRKLSESCSSCHGITGNSRDPLVPSLAAQDFRYLVRATIEYRDNKRKHQGMSGAVEKLSNQQITDISAFYAMQQAEKPNGVYVPEEPKLLIENKCVLCHGPRGFSNEFDKPRLAGQSEAYLISAMQQYANGSRSHSAMQAMADVLSLIEIKGIAAYYARQKE